MRCILNYNYIILPYCGKCNYNSVKRIIIGSI